jgi:uncharacterized protein YegJ (DUF2314 family)
MLHEYKKFPAFCCDWSGFYTRTRTFIPVTKNGKMKKYAFLDANCAVAFLHSDQCTLPEPVKKNALKFLYSAAEKEIVPAPPVPDGILKKKRFIDLYRQHRVKVNEYQESVLSYEKSSRMTVKTVDHNTEENAEVEEFNNVNVIINDGPRRKIRKLNTSKFSLARVVKDAGYECNHFMVSQLQHNRIVLYPTLMADPAYVKAVCNENVTVDFDIPKDVYKDGVASQTPSGVTATGSNP